MDQVSARTNVMSRSVPRAQSVPVLVGTNQALRDASAAQRQAVTSSVAPVHLMGPSSHYIPQVPITHAPTVLGPVQTSASSSASRLGYFQQIGSGVNPTALIPRVPQLTPSAFIGGTAGSVAYPLPTPDAMGYLEQVKTQFASKQQIYNEFLEAMKRFKDQTLDLIGVVKRIGGLFLEFTHLIIGFNTFMPHGYRLDVSNDRAERIIVYSPTGKLHAFSEDELLAERQSSRVRDLEPSVVYRRSTNAQTGEDTFVPPESSCALAYVNKIKIRFQSNPEVYQQFLEILQSYQKEQQDRPTGSSGRSSVADAQVFSKVAKLFANDKDLLEEFSQFLPDAPLMQLEEPSPSTAVSTSSEETVDSVAPSSMNTDEAQQVVPPISKSSYTVGSSDSNQATSLRITRRKRKPIGQAVIESSESVMTRKRTRSTLVHMERSITVTTEVKEVHQAEYSTGNDAQLSSSFSKSTSSSASAGEAMSSEGPIQRQERTIFDGFSNVDFCRCKQYGVSYRFIPTMYQYPKCAGRTALAKEVLNFKYLSFPIWQSEENPTVVTKRSPYQEMLYTTEDERFEADMVITANRCLIEALHNASVKIGHLKRSDLGDFQLDETLNTRSVMIAERALRLVFGEAWQEFYMCLREHPAKAIPPVLNVLMKKNDEWQRNLTSMNRAWQETNEKSYWKALDYQYTTFKQQDVKSMRTRALLHNIETLYEERRDKAEKENKKIPSGPHIVIHFPTCETAFYDVGDLVIHYVRRQTSINPLNKRRITRIVRVLLPALFHLEPRNLSDAEQDFPSECRPKIKSIINGPNGRGSAMCRGRLRGNSRRRGSGKGRGNAKISSTTAEATTTDDKKNESLQDIVILQDLKLLRAMPQYTVMFMPNPWYVFLRQYCILNERLARFYEICCDLVSRRGEPDSSYLYQTAALRNRFTSNNNVQPKHLYSQFINLTKHWLDDSIDSATYEDAVRDVFTLHAYKAFTILKIIQMMTRQLQLMVTDLTAVKAFKMYETWMSKICWTPEPSDRELLEISYQEEAMALMVSQNCIKIVLLPLDNRKVTFELLNTDSSDEKPDEHEESNGGASPEAGERVKGEVLQRNFNDAIRHFSKELAALEQTTPKGKRNACTSQADSEIVRNVCEHLYWQCGGEAQESSSSWKAPLPPFTTRILKKFWDNGKKKKDACHTRPKHGENFCLFHESWINHNVSNERSRHVKQLLMGRRYDKTMSAAWMRRQEEPCYRRPPYYSVNVYLKFDCKRSDDEEDKSE